MILPIPTQLAEARADTSRMTHFPNPCLVSLRKACRTATAVVSTLGALILIVACGGDRRQAIQACQHIADKCRVEFSPGYIHECADNWAEARKWMDENTFYDALDCTRTAATCPEVIGCMAGAGGRLFEGAERGFERMMGRKNDGMRSHAKQNSDDRSHPDESTDESSHSDKSADQPSRSDRPSEDRTADDRPRSDRPSDDRPADDRPRSDKSADEPSRSDRPSDDNSHPRPRVSVGNLWHRFGVFGRNNAPLPRECQRANSVCADDEPFARDGCRDLVGNLRADADSLKEVAECYDSANNCYQFQNCTHNMMFKLMLGD